MNLSTYTNIFGEEWIAYSRGGELFIRGRDVDWEEHAVDLATGRVPDLIIDDGERAWIAACAWTQRTLNERPK